MAAQRNLKEEIIRWKPLNEKAAMLIFLTAAVLIELAIVLSAQGLGVTETHEHRIFGAVSPLFHLVPSAVIIALTFSWKHLIGHMAAESRERVKKSGLPTAKVSRKPKEQISMGKSFAYIKHKTSGAAVKSALTVLSLFVVFVFIVYLLANPRLIYEAVVNAYRSNAEFLNFVKGTTGALSPIFVFFSSIGKALIPVAPSFRNFVLAVGAIVDPLANLDAVGKYLAFQNAAAWISALFVLFYGWYLQKWRTRRLRKKR